MTIPNPHLTIHFDWTRVTGKCLTKINATTSTQFLEDKFGCVIYSKAPHQNMNQTCLLEYAKTLPYNMKYVPFSVKKDCPIFFGCILYNSIQYTDTLWHISIAGDSPACKDFDNSMGEEQTLMEAISKLDSIVCIDSTGCTSIIGKWTIIVEREKYDQICESINATLLNHCTFLSSLDLINEIKYPDFRHPKRMAAPQRAILPALCTTYTECLAKSYDLDLPILPIPKINNRRQFNIRMVLYKSIAVKNITNNTSCNIGFTEALSVVSRSNSLFSLISEHLIKSMISSAMKLVIKQQQNK